jgi:hypothetical protein
MSHQPTLGYSVSLAMVTWSKEKPADFYKIAARPILTETASKGGPNLTVEIAKFSRLKDAPLTRLVIAQN